MAPGVTDATALTGPSLRCRRRVTVTGVVQGVGFRPFVHRVATDLGLTGFVGNDSAAVFIEVQGSGEAVQTFDRRLRAEKPPLAVIDDVSSTDLAVEPTDDHFEIVASRAALTAATAVPPDVAVCDECVAELFDSENRRYRHPFITCTNCGPRFTIIRELPYDRPATTMADFAMCTNCSREYSDPADRRFHAQPIACPECGPTMWFRTADLRVTGVDRALAATHHALADSQIVGIKGIGGYHLACAADDEVAVAALRARKARGGKPFAVMVPDLDTAREYAELDDSQAAALTGPARPIILLRRRNTARLSPQVAPGSPWIGLMLPYTPVHHLLFARSAGSTCAPPTALVMTSANLSGEPICYTDDDVERRLTGLCDAVLDHDRGIYVPCDDSVVRVIDGCELPIRRSRGYAPLPVDLGVDGPTVLGVGGELKNTFCLVDGRRAFMSAHIGDMGSPQTLEAFSQAVSQLTGLRTEPERLAADLHPGYFTRDWAEREAGRRPIDLVQHHHAHVVSLLAEHARLGQPIVGVAFDGTGFGLDGTVWGGEFLRLGADSSRFERVAHLAPVPMAGGDAAVRNPWRMALAHLWAAGVSWDADLAPVATASGAERALLRSQFESGQGCVPCTSMGRLFDAVASLLGVCHRIGYEGQAAIELEVLAESADLHRDAALRFSITDGTLDPGPLLVDMVAALRDGVAPAVLAAEFHHAVAVGVAAIVTQVAGDTRLTGLTGGVFQNLLLLAQCRNRLQEAGFTVLTHQVVPPNDGGLALGQAAVSRLTSLAADGRTDRRD